MTPTDKLLKKEFKISSQEVFFKYIDKKEDDFFKNNFFTDKQSYIQMLQNLIQSINDIGYNYSGYMEMVKSGSILNGVWSSAAFGAIQKEYREKRKQFKNHARFFL